MKTNIALFFSYGISLRRWDEMGILHREIALYQRLMEQGVQVTFVTYGDSSDYQYQNILPGIEIVPVYASRKRPRFSLMRFFRSFALPFQLRKRLETISHLKTNQMWGAWVPVILKYLMKRPLIVRCGYEMHQTMNQEGKGILFRSFIYWLSMIAYKSADRIVITAHSLADYVETTFRIPNSKITVLPNFIDTALFSPVAKQEKDTRVLFVGRLVRQKNLKALVEATRMARVGLDLIGKGPEEDDLRRWAAQIGADVRFLGVIPNRELPKMYSRYSMFLLPSHFEGNPKTLLEAMSCGCAVVASDIQENKNVIESGKNGLICGRSPQKIATAIQDLKSNHALRDEIGKEARSAVLKNNSLDRIVKRETAIYGELA